MTSPHGPPPDERPGDGSVDHPPDRAARTDTATDPGPASDPVPSGGTPTAGGASVRTLWRRHRVVVVVLLGIVLVATGIGIAQTRGVGGRLDPRSAAPEGGRALAVLLGERGVRVERVTDPATLTAGVNDRTVVLVVVPSLLGEDAIRSVGELATGTVVLVAPTTEALGEVADGVRRSGTVPVRARGPGCSEPAAEAAGDALSGGATFTTEDGASCYRGGEQDGSLVTGETRGGARLLLLGTGQQLTNERLAQDGNAALALNLLGADGSASELRWLVPSPGSAADGDGGSLTAILPAWVVPAVLQLLFAGLLLALWRGRRLGPPVVEPLPVVVRAAEAVEGRARLYRRAQARDRAAEALRSGALARLVPRLGVDSAAGGEPAPEAVVAAVAARSGRPDAEVHAALFGGPPVDDAGLVHLTETLDSMVRSTLDPEVPHS